MLQPFLVANGKQPAFGRQCAYVMAHSNSKEQALKIYQGISNLDQTGDFLVRSLGAIPQLLYHWREEEA